MILLLLMAIACSSVKESRDTTVTDSPSVPAGETGTPEEDPPPVDTGLPTNDTGDPEPPVEVPVSAVSEPVTCDNPALRESAGPMRLHTPFGDWRNQNGEANLWSLYGGAGMAIADFDGNGWYDIFMPNADGDQLYMGWPGLSFEDESSGRLPAESDVGVGATPVDADGDGDLDIFVAVALSANRLLINDGTGHFSQADGEWLAQQGRLSHGSSWGDIDGDGDLDVFVANYSNWSEDWLAVPPVAPTEMYADSLWINDGLMQFSNADEWLGGMDPAGAFTFASGFWDLDDDGDLDLMAVNDYRFEYPWAEPVRYLENTGYGFSDADPRVGLDLEVEGMGLAVGELNGDDALDVVVQAWTTHMMLSDGSGGFYEAAASRGVTATSQQQVGWGVLLADLTNDGRLDMPVAYGLLPPDEVSMGPMPEFVIGDMLNMNRVHQPNALYVQGEDGQFSDVGPDWGLDHDGISRGLLTVDLNHDGFLDLIERDLWGPTRIHISRCDDSAWIAIKLRQEGLNPYAVGAKVRVVNGEIRHTRVIEAGSSSLSSGGPPEVHFGLGAMDTVERIEVQWPDGATSRLDDVATRARMTVTRD